MLTAVALALLLDFVSSGCSNYTYYGCGSCVNHDCVWSDYDQECVSPATTQPPATATGSRRLLGDEELISNAAYCCDLHSDCDSCVADDGCSWEESRRRLGSTDTSSYDMTCVYHTRRELDESTYTSYECPYETTEEVERSFGPPLIERWWFWMISGTVLVFIVWSLISFWMYGHESEMHANEFAHIHVPEDGHKHGDSDLIEEVRITKLEERYSSILSTEALVEQLGKNTMLTVEDVTGYDDELRYGQLTEGGDGGDVSEDLFAEIQESLVSRLPE